VIETPVIPPPVITLSRGMRSLALPHPALDHCCLA
jgi:hypothetical protein